MAKLQEIMGQEVYDLLYTHYDRHGALIEDMDDVLFCEDDEIPRYRIPKLEALLTPITDTKNSLIPIEAAKLLAAWGSEKALDYLDSCINQRIDLLGSIDPHRLYHYDTLYERIADSYFQYYIRSAERDYVHNKSYSGPLGEKARRRIKSPVENIIKLSRDVTIDLSTLIKKIQKHNWREYLPVLNECYADFIERASDNLNSQWNLAALKELIHEWNEPPSPQQNEKNLL